MRRKTVIEITYETDMMGCERSSQAWALGDGTLDFEAGEEIAKALFSRLQTADGRGGIRVTLRSMRFDVPDWVAEGKEEEFIFDVFPTHDIRVQNAVDVMFTQVYARQYRSETSSLPFRKVEA